MFFYIMWEHDHVVLKQGIYKKIKSRNIGSDSTEVRLLYTGIDPEILKRAKQTTKSLRNIVSHEKKGQKLKTVPKGGHGSPTPDLPLLYCHYEN